VFDLRGYLTPTTRCCCTCSRASDDSNAWLAVPHVIRPDHTATAMPSWDTSGLALPVLQPHIGGRVAFLIGPRRMAAGDHERASIWSRIGSLEDPE